MRQMEFAAVAREETVLVGCRHHVVLMEVRPCRISNGGGDRRAVREPVFCHSPYRVQGSRQTTAAGEEAERRLRKEARPGQGRRGSHRPRRNE